ncbi:transcriptional regulator, IclR family [Paenibacillus sp. UNC496MF]|uniref:IclR family transcriptional regulator n=1 Tax=Paenibacillus sp. UNC496MF TaxID=1502753 RepID=UPI0008DF10FA|nr:IclR family transcriptional regulator [Paenibacillus sp. UNC496MF]SFJ91350.1 transcriptional regulator, IclR family [Paenibacillus sp. UNC496MF]
MDQKYNVPALDRANAVLKMLSEQPYTWKLSDLSKQLDISKSTLFSLLQTLERLQWISRDRHETYAIGSALGQLGGAFFRQFNLTEDFKRLAEPVMLKLKESVQLAMLEGGDVLYLAKVAASSPVQMVSGPGVRFPAHATGLGKALMSNLGEEEIRQLFPQELLPKLTMHSIGTREALLQEIRQANENGYATDIQEGVMGFCCVAAPIRRPDGTLLAAVSCSMPIHHWEGKKEDATREIIALARRLSPGI